METGTFRVKSGLADERMLFLETQKGTGTPLASHLMGTCIFNCQTDRPATVVTCSHQRSSVPSPPSTTCRLFLACCCSPSDPYPSPPPNISHYRILSSSSTLSVIMECGHATSRAADFSGRGRGARPPRP